VVNEVKVILHPFKIGLNLVNDVPGILFNLLQLLNVITLIQLIHLVLQLGKPSFSGINSVSKHAKLLLRLRVRQKLPPPHEIIIKHIEITVLTKLLKPFLKLQLRLKVLNRGSLAPPKVKADLAHEIWTQSRDQFGNLRLYRPKLVDCLCGPYDEVRSSKEADVVVRPDADAIQVDSLHLCQRGNARHVALQKEGVFVIVSSPIHSFSRAIAVRV
jgi:hypothetical protein